MIAQDRTGLPGVASCGAFAHLRRGGVSAQQRTTNGHGGAGRTTGDQSFCSRLCERREAQSVCVAPER